VNRQGSSSANTQSERLQCSRWAIQRGQALPLGLAFIMIGMLGGLVLFNTGQVAVDKQRLANAADSAAYSGMVWQARALNFQAYSNRAMIANQVSIGQAVSLYSWADYAETTGENINRVFGWIPYVGQFVSIMETVIKVIANITRPVAEGVVTVISPINKAISISQKAVYASSFAATPDIVRNVAKASDSRFTADTGFSALGLTSNLSGWKDFTQEYTDTDTVDMRERTKLVNDSRDTFSEDRYWDFYDSFWIYSTPFTKHKLFREGESRLVMSTDDDGDNPKWEWMAKDTLALHNKIWRGWRGTKNQELPIGWGAAYANDFGGDSMVVKTCNRLGYRGGENCRYRNRNKRTERVANRVLESIDNYAGINTFRSISESVRNPTEGEAVLRLKTEVSMELDTVESTEHFVTNQDPFATPMVSPGDKISSISVAEVYYRRPEAYTSNEDHIRYEPANGYNPYWDVRLAPVEAVDRLAALGMRGDFGNDTTLPGGDAAQALAGYEAPESEDTDGSSTDNESVTASTLADYEGATLASVMGVSDAAVSALVASNPGEFIASNIDGFIDVGDFKAELEDTIKDELENAARELLEGAVRSAIESAVDQYAPGAIENVENAIDLADDAVALAEGLSEKYEQLREKVQAEFQVALENQVATYEAELEPITGDITRVAQELEDINEERVLAMWRRV